MKTRQPFLIPLQTITTTTTRREKLCRLQIQPNEEEHEERGLEPYIEREVRDAKQEKQGPCCNARRRVAV